MDILERLRDSSPNESSHELCCLRTDAADEIYKLRGALLYLMSQFDNETWNCERCGHSEDTKTMDSAFWLRDFLSNQ